MSDRRSTEGSCASTTIACRSHDGSPPDSVDLRAAKVMGKLHDALAASNYTGHPLELLLVRLLFCLFAEDTGIFQPKGSFRLWIEDRTAEDGSDLGPHLERLFQTLNTPETKRSPNLDEQVAAFPYVDGRLFEERLPIAEFNAAMRESLLDCCALDWSAISPAIFGALFQSIMDGEARRSLGAHYTSEENILKLIKPLFLDELRAEFSRIRKNRSKLIEFHKKLRTLTFLDPACGCGNFLVVAYRELRMLELDVLLVVHKNMEMRLWDIHEELRVDVDQFHGIEIEEFPAQIAQVAMWLVDHQMNTCVSQKFGLYFARIPLRSIPHIVQGNALTMDWNDVLPVHRATYVLGNPPFVGAKYMTPTQRKDSREVFRGVDGGGLLDYVAAWYVKAVQYNGDTRVEGSGFRVLGSGQRSEAGDVGALLAASPSVRFIRCAFVSTNSITQGEQVGVLWGWLLEQGVRIHFAHRTFQWSNEAKGVAAVHCVIIGFGLHDVPEKTLFDYEDIRGEPQATTASNINPYLVDAPNLVLRRRSAPICDVPAMAIGNKPIDGGHYLFSDDEKAAFLAVEPKAKRYFRRWMGAVEFINGISRWCLWLGDATPSELRAMPECMKRVEAVRRYRQASKSAPTQRLAETPTRFHVELMPKGSFMVIPEVSSERREYIPLGYLAAPTLASNKLRLLPDAGGFHFSVLHSSMHMAWTRAVCGRMKSDYQYSVKVVYNNFPWPEPTTKQRAAMEAAAQGILDARALHPKATLADLYDTLSMPRELRRAHAANDRAVDAAYGYRGGASDAARVAFLFGVVGRKLGSEP